MTGSVKKGGVQRALVVGGSGMVGEGIVRALVEKGFDVAFTYCANGEKAASMETGLKAAGGRVFSFKMDILEPKDIVDGVERAYEALGGLDSLVIASGIASAYEKDGQRALPSIDEITPEVFDKMFGVNVRGAFFVCQRAARLMKDGGGRIAVIGSVDGVKIAHPPADYTASKAALWGLVRSLSKELGPKILVNLVAPGVLDGGIAGYLTPVMMAEYLKHNSMKRTGRFAEIANVTAFLVGAKNTYITGQAVIVDGGL